MNTKISKKIMIVIAVASMVSTIVPFFASAEGLGLGVDTNISIHTNGNNDDVKLTKIISRGDSDVDERITALNNLNIRIQDFKNVSAEEKGRISSEVQTNITRLNALKVKIDSDTDIKVAENDDKSVFDLFRIYSLVIPHGYIIASADRINTIDVMLTTVSAKLQTRISAEQSKGNNVSTLQTSLTDMNAKIADAKLQVQAALNITASLTPDHGDKTLIATNKNALKNAHVDIKLATNDLQMARADAHVIIRGLNALDRDLEKKDNDSATTTIKR